jgi:hypothetical protein
MKNAILSAWHAVFVCAILLTTPAPAQQFENTFGLPVNHEDPQDGKPIANGRYVVLSNTLSFGEASRILLTTLEASGAVSSNVIIHHPAIPATGYFGAAIELDYNAAGTHTGYFIAGSRTTANGRQAILLRTSTTGTVTWVKILPNADASGALDERAVSVERQSNGDVILTASAYSPAAGNHRFTVSRFTSAGTQVWSNRYFGATTGQSFEATEAANAVRSGVAVLVVTGRYWVAGNAASHTFLSCIDAATGNEVWRRSYDSGLERDAGIDVVYKPANGAEAAALMVVGYAGMIASNLWVVRANPLNGLASSKVYAASGFTQAFSADAVTLDVTGTRAALTGAISFQPAPGVQVSGAFAMVLPFYGTELPDWTYYYSSSAPPTPAPHSISRITGAAGYFLTAGSRLTGSLFNDAHAIRVDALGSNGPAGCDITPITVTRTATGTNAWREFVKTPNAWTNFMLTAIPVTLVQETCSDAPVNSDRAAAEAAEPRLAPNPVAAGQAAVLTFDLPQAQSVRVRVLDLTGRHVWSFDSMLGAGRQALELPVGQWNSGAYLVQMQSPAWNRTLKLLVSRN